ncbi:sugar transporter SemiSWEET [Aliidongia dinghuensis]|uniref:Sugar transporter SemiSWEET n=1 Tax=Aliidongia dinghuensis TaxID=1867774 RepID=A0A8J3E333_9PROT|nr:SemiSWEET transporter [Aliidongia dinghuensis]GGF03453.1 sugar transporter SemiSWEET [Aliidongia dinghuensis]
MTEDAVELLGLVAGLLTTASFLPQVVKVLREKNTAGISLGMYAAFTVGVALWLVYGLLLGRPAIIVPNLVTLLLAGLVLVLKLRHG